MVESKLKRKSADVDVQKVNSMRCYKYKCCQTFSWDDTLALKQKFYSSSFEVHRKIAYAMQGQLHSLPERQNKFITLCNKVCENAWYIIHGVSRSAYYKYKVVTNAKRINDMHGNAGIASSQAHTI